MLQIISGKFYNNDNEIRHNFCKGVLYSNAAFFSIAPFKLGNIEIDTVDWVTGLPTYVVSYDNAIENNQHTKVLVKIGDYEIVEELKYIISFANNVIFDEREEVVNSLCKKDIYQNNFPSNYVNNVFDLNRKLTNDDWENCRNFYEKVIGLSRVDYKIIIKCLAAYNSSFMVLKNDFSLAYSILVYVLETLSDNYDGYLPTWEDYDQSIKLKIDKQLSEVDEEIANNIRAILVKEKHLKLSKRFCDFIMKYIDKAYYRATDIFQITEDELKNAVNLAYSIRSKYAHTLKPVMKELEYASLNTNTEVFIWNHESYLTYAGLLRLTRTVIFNFIDSREKIEYEDYNWYDELPGTINIPLHPKYLICRNIDEELKMIVKKFEMFINIYVDLKKIPQINSLIENYAKNINRIKNNEKCFAYALCWIYVNKVSELDEKFKSKIINELEKYKDLEKEYNIAILTCMIFGLEYDTFDVEKVIECVDEYNKYKFKENHVRLPSSIENSIYTKLAESFKCKGDKENELKWYNKAFKNATNDKELQNAIQDEIDKTAF